MEKPEQVSKEQKLQLIEGLGKLNLNLSRPKP